MGIQEGYDDQKPAGKSSPLKLFLFGGGSGTKNAVCDVIDQYLTLEFVEFPELMSFQQLECLASGHSWLLLVSRETPSLFFFNRVTRRRIDLPFPHPTCSAAAFSTPPTSPHCTVIAIQRDNNISTDQSNVHVLKLGNNKNTWTRFANNSAAFGTVMQTVYSNGIFYLMDLEGRISSFDIKQGSLRVISEKQFDYDGGSYLVEFNGEIFGVFGSIEKVYRVIKIGDHGEAIPTWEERINMADITLFLGPRGSFAISGLAEQHSEKIFVARSEPELSLVNFKYHNDSRTSSMISKLYFTHFSRSHIPVWI